MMPSPSSPAGVVLAGAAALGAYEAGVLHHVVDAVARDVGRARVLDVVSGTSAGAINILLLGTRKRYSRRY